MASDPTIGEIPDHWELTTLGEVCGRTGGNIQTGPFGSQLHAADYVKVGIPSIMPVNIGDNRIEITDIKCITEIDAERLSKHRVQPGDIIYSRRGDVERRALIREREDGWLCGTGCLKVSFGKGCVDPTYAAYYLGHPRVRGWIVRHAVGATMPNLNTSIMSAVPFALAPFPEQKAIAHILGTLDDKIELNRKMNETLEEMARTIFKSWFVDFDPVRAKLDGRQPAGMPPEIAALFPYEFEDSKLGKIPKGWVVKKLGETVSVNPQQIGKQYPFDEIEYVDISSVSAGKLSETSKYNLADAPSRAKRLVNHGDTIWSCVRPNRKSFYFVHTPAINLVVSTGFAVLHPNLITPTFLYYTVTSEDFVAYLTQNAHGSAYPAVRGDTFERAEYLCPNREILDSFEKTVSSFRDMIRLNDHESLTLSQLRDTLLPKLLSGELRVPEAEKQIELAL